MKCTACGENNVDNAKFCAFCGAKFDEKRHMPNLQAPGEVPEGAQPAPSARHTRFCVNDYILRLAYAACKQRISAEDRAGRIAAGIADEPRGFYPVAVQLRQTVDRFL